MGDRLQAKPLTEGALLTAITVLMALVGAYLIPYIIFLIPVPLTIIVYRHGLRLGISVATSSALLAGIVVHLLSVLVWLLVMGLVGIALGEAFREKFGAVKILSIGSIVSAGALLLMFLISYALFGINLVDVFEKMMTESMDQVIAIYKELGRSQDELSIMREKLEQYFRLIRVVMPGTLVITAVMLTLVNYWLARLILERLEGKAVVAWFPEFKTWRVPWYWAWGYILGTGLLLAYSLTGQRILMVIGFNLEVLFSYVFFIQGVAIGWFFLDKHKVHKTWRTIAVVFVLLTRSLFLIVTWMGVLDTWFDLRDRFA